MKFKLLFFVVMFFSSFLVLQQHSYAQKITNTNIKMDTTKAAKKNYVTKPRVAAKRSAILPGWGQVYNHKIWKVPIVYAGLGITAAIFINNLKEYNKIKYATKVAFNMQNNKLLDPITWTYTRTDSSGFDAVDNRLKPFLGNVSTLVANRGSFRQNIDYSVLAFVLMWGLQVVDATVDAHLSSFDVSDKLSINIKPIIPNSSSLGLAFALSKPKKTLPATF